jgi:hypothetical protein
VSLIFTQLGHFELARGEVFLAINLIGFGFVVLFLISILFVVFFGVAAFAIRRGDISAPDLGVAAAQGPARARLGLDPDPGKSIVSRAATLFPDPHGINQINARLSGSKISFQDARIESPGISLKR